jgi:hypothetical protein
MSKSRRVKPNSIAARVARRLDTFLKQNVIDLSAVREGREIAEKLQSEGPDPAALTELHPAHALYVFVLNQASILAEALTQLAELDRISSVVSRAEDTYMPGGPPMSPLTRSYFNSWVFFDCGVGLERETLGTVILHLRDRIRMHPEFATVLEKWQMSRMGLYELESHAKETVKLRELVTNNSIEAINPTRYPGKPGSVWFVRALPPPSPTFREHIIVTTPYEIVGPPVAGWMAYLERTLPKTKIVEPKRAYEFLMKWGLSHDYWHEYVFEAYAGYETDGIRLMGLPDVPESLPHSRMNENDDGRALRQYLVSGRMATGALA